MSGLDFAKAAESFVGTRFRLHGRDPRNGLDCIGLISASLAMIGRPARFPIGYSLRTSRWRMLDELAPGLGLAPAALPISPGDVCLCRPSTSQMHFIIAATCSGSFVEAHAGLRRIVITPPAYPHPIEACWRLSDLPR